MTDNNYNPNNCHQYIMKNRKRKMGFNPDRDFSRWQDEMQEKFKQIVGEMAEEVPLNIRVEYETEHDGYSEKRFTFTSEQYADVPCHLIIPEGKGPFPVIITLQGHSSGMYLSLGEAKDDHDHELLDGDRDFGLQAIDNGYAALVMEQRCFGEREDREREEGSRCHQATMTALLLGRTMVGERVLDVKRGIDVLETFPVIDNNKIGLMGHSGGGTVTYYATCLEPRIKAAMPSCSICTYRDSIGSIYHCEDNYLPGAYKYFEMGDLAGLIAPRPLIVVAGKEDPIFPIEGVKENFDIIKNIYDAAGVADKCQLVIGEGGHRFYAEQAWPVFNELTGW